MESFEGIWSIRLDQIPSKDSMPGSLYSDLAKKMCIRDRGMGAKVHVLKENNPDQQLRSRNEY